MSPVNSTTSPSLTTKIAALAEQGIGTELSGSTARDLLEHLCQDTPDVPKFLLRKGLRLPENQQEVVLQILHAAQATEFATVLEAWSRSPGVSLRIRARAATTLQHLGQALDESYHDALQRAHTLSCELAGLEELPVNEAGELDQILRSAVLDLPLTLALDVAREVMTDRPHHALAVLRLLRSVADAQDRLALVEALATLPLAESAVILCELLDESREKAAQKAIKKALHRLKTQGVHVDESQKPARSVVGAVTHRLERCLASHIDANGDRVLWMIRTKAFGGYNIAYLVINYGSGLQRALALQASKRELPQLLEHAQEYAPLIDLDPAYCQFQVARAHQMNLESGTPVPEEFFAMRDIIGEASETFERSLIYTVLSDADLQEASAYTEHASDLLDLPEFAGWTLPETIVQKYGDELYSLEESNIVVSPALQRERVNAVYARAAEEVLGEATRHIMQLRLEEMAYYLLQTERRREALWAVAAVQSLENPDPERLRTNPFVGSLLARSLERAKRRPSSNIILPFAPSPAAGSPPSRAAEPEPERRIII
jgi:hypothetical protein